MPFSSSNELAIDDHGVALDPFKRLCDFDVAIANDLAIAAVKRDLAAFDFGDHPKPVILSSNIQPASSKGASVSVASIGWKRFGSVVVRPMLMNLIATGF